MLRSVRRLVVVCVLSAGVCTTAARAQSGSPIVAGELADAATLRARIARAAGPKPERERIAKVFTFGGLAGTSVAFRIGKNERTLETDAPFHSAYGEYGGQAWEQNRNGEVVLSQPDPGQATDEKLRTSVTRVAKPFDAYVLSELNVHGEGSRDYIDPTTYRILRREKIAATQTTTTNYDDFRTNLGYTQPWHSHSEDGIATDTTDERFTSVDANVTLADVKIPGSQTFVEFPAGKTSVMLPVKLTEDGKFLVRVTIAGRGLDFILDTGDALGITLDEDIVKELGLKIYETHSNAGAAQRVSTSTAIVPAMTIGDLKMHDVAIDTVPDVGMEVPHLYKAVGLLGFDFIADIALKLDYSGAGSVTAMTAASFVPPDRENSIALPIRIGSGSPMVDVHVNGALGERFAVDTGGAGGLMIGDSFARRHPEAMRDEGGRPPVNVYFSGIGGEFKADPIQLKSVEIGQVNFTDFIAYHIGPKSYAGDFDGTIGPYFLHFFTVYTDYADSLLYLSKQGLHGHPSARK